MTWLQSASRLSVRVITSVLLLAHLLAAIALVAFGWRAGGFALNGPASYGYLLLSGLATLIFFITIRRDDAWAEAGRVVLAPCLALVVAGVWFATAVFGAKYAPYGAFDGAELYALINAAYAGLGIALALGLRWPRLLLAWIMAHGLGLVLGVAVFGQLRYAALALVPPVYMLWLFVPLAYGLAGLALGWRPTWRTLRPSGWQALIGLALALAGLISLRNQLLEGGALPADLWINLAAGAPGVVWFTAFLLPLSLYAWWARAQWDPQTLEQSSTVPVWVAFAVAVLFGAGLAAYLLSPELLPRAGEVQGWISSIHIVAADAWLPSLGWSTWLFGAARWLLVPLAILGLGLLGQAWRRRTTITPAAWLLWTSLVALLAFGLESLTPIRLISNIVLSGIRSPWFNWALLSAEPYLLVLGLFFASRLWERALGLRLRASLALFIFALLGLFMLSHVAGVWTYVRFLFFPLAPWAQVAEYAPAPPSLLAGLGLALHLMALSFGVMVSLRWLRRLRAERGLGVDFWPALSRFAWVGGGAFLALVVIWYGITLSRPSRVVPAPGATGVPLDTLVLIEFPPPSGLDSFLEGGYVSGLESRYADTGELIRGVTMGSASGLTFDPDDLLRPGAVVEIIGRWTGKRPYVLRFTTAGSAEPSATPLPFPTQWPGPMPTAAAQD